MQSASTIAPIESDKVEDLCNKLSSLIGHSSDTTSADGVGYIDGFAAPACIMEVNHEYGETGYDPATQASFSFQNHWKTSGVSGIEDWYIYKVTMSCRQPTCAKDVVVPLSY